MKRMREMPWRVGRKLGRTVYAQVSDDPDDKDVLLGMMDSVEIAQHIVDRHNEWLQKENG